MTNKTFKRNSCPSCAAELVFNPEAGKLKCEYCGWEDYIHQNEEELQENFYQQYLTNDLTQLAILSTTAMEVTCHSCGANITFEPPQIAGQCPFCASSIVAQPKQADPTIAPQGIIPFTFGRKIAKEHLQAWISSLWFAPNDFKKLAQPETIQGIYLPFWTYDAHTKSNYKGKKVMKEGADKNVSGCVERFFDDVLIPATKLVDYKRLQELEPWHLKESLQPYDISYLAGFDAQRSQVELDEGFEKAKAAMKSQISSDIRREIGGDEQVIDELSTSYDSITFKHILLPVWLISYCYREKQYQILINAKTGEVIGESPHSAAKAILFPIGFLFGMGAILHTISYIMRFLSNISN